MKLQQITEQDEVKVGDVLIDRHPVSEKILTVTVTRVTKTRVFTNTGMQFTKDGCNPDDRLMRFRPRLFKAVEVE